MLAVVTLIAVLVMLRPISNQIARCICLAALAFLGAALAFAFFLRASFWLADSPDGTRWHMILAGVAAAATLMPLIFRRAALAAAGLPFTATLAALLGWSAWVYPSHVRQSAEAIAAGKPYCIEHALELDRIFHSGWPKDSDTRKEGPIAARDDLSFLTFDMGNGHLWVEDLQDAAAGGSQVNGRYLSRTDRAFEADGTLQMKHFGSVSFACIPRTDFLDRLDASRDMQMAIFTPVWQGKQRVAVDKEALRIPDAYLRKTGDSWNWNITIFSSLPEFEPLSGGNTTPRENQKQSLYYDLMGSDEEYQRGLLAMGQHINDFIFPAAEYFRAPDLAEESVIDPSGLLSNHSNKDRSVHALYSPNGKLLTAINCQNGNCRHFFVPGDSFPHALGPIEFSYPIEMLPQWQQLQTALQLRFTSFLVTN